MKKNLLLLTFVLFPLFSMASDEGSKNQAEFEKLMCKMKKSEKVDDLDIARLKELMNSGIDVTKPIKIGCRRVSPLFIIAEKGDGDSLQLFKEKGGNLLFVGWAGKTALEFAACAKNLDTTKFLVEYFNDEQVYEAFHGLLINFKKIIDRGLHGNESEQKLFGMDVQFCSHIDKEDFEVIELLKSHGAKLQNQDDFCWLASLAALYKIECSLNTIELEESLIKKKCDYIKSICMSLAEEFAKRRGWEIEPWNELLAFGLEILGFGESTEMYFGSNDSDTDNSDDSDTDN
ncbi:MAG: hypothetical protein UR26_C0002G0146 [candidate division TM6 bacterium GW2011_GWF2_32_72]|nr:MAG: hypothetical protein UR26_C0002G0146 [candidate division TM6 bacterium GW2011_GWF2_32_72]